jgi:UDP-N-acetyl-2-amino-2-deoxyglucuronate dehydrogenase
MSGKKFGLIGAAGYIAPRHMKAIKYVNGDLIAAMDTKDSVGVIDSYYPNAAFFTEFELFDRHCDLLRRSGRKIDYISTCSPNYLHDAHIRFSLRSDAHAICEKPLVLNPYDIDSLEQLEKETGKKVWTILQLRLHDAVRKLRERVSASNKRYSCDLTYITSRGNWYHNSWKGDVSKSGGLATNIGVHFFDMLTYIFGMPKEQHAHLREPERAAGFLSFEKADIKWFLSVNKNDLPEVVKGKKTTYRSLKIDGEEFEFSEGFTDLHDISYKNILEGNGFGLKDVRPCIEIVSQFRELITTNHGEIHEFVKNYK